MIEIRRRFRGIGSVIQIKDAHPWGLTGGYRSGPLLILSIGGRQKARTLHGEFSRSGCESYAFGGSLAKFSTPEGIWNPKRDG